MALAVFDRSEFVKEVFRGVLDYARHRRGWEFLTFRNEPFVSFNEIDLSSIDGLIGNINWNREVDQVLAAGVLAVSTAENIEDPRLPHVITDNLAVGRLGAEHLLRRGFRNFGFVSHGRLWFSRQRETGFRSVIEAASGHACHVFDEPMHVLESPATQLGSWLAGLPKPVAIMAANDIRGRDVVNAAAGEGLRVPEDVAVLGVDNDEWHTALVSTPLSSIRLDTRQEGYRAAMMLDELLRGQPAPASQLIPPIGVVTRQSTEVSLSKDPLVSEALRVIETRCAEPIGIDHVLDTVGVSRRTLENRMKRALGKTPHAALCDARVSKAKGLLTDSRMTVNQIAHACGFDRQGNFTKMFKRVTGLTPGQYREQYGR